jgi:hypothetical protein
VEGEAETVFILKYSQSALISVKDVVSGRGRMPRYGVTIMTNNKSEIPEEPQHGNPWLNIGKLVFLIAVLVAAWFVLERLIGSK